MFISTMTLSQTRGRRLLWRRVFSLQICECIAVLLPSKKGFCENQEADGVANAARPLAKPQAVNKTMEFQPCCYSGAVFRFLILFLLSKTS